LHGCITASGKPAVEIPGESLLLDAVAGQFAFDRGIQNDIGRGLQALAGVKAFLDQFVDQIARLRRCVHGPLLSISDLSLDRAILISTPLLQWVYFRNFD
jgi:hypothetical protein